MKKTITIIVFLMALSGCSKETAEGFSWGDSLSGSTVNDLIRVQAKEGHTLNFCEGKENCRELVIVDDGIEHVFTFEEILKLRQQ